MKNIPFTTNAPIVPLSQTVEPVRGQNRGGQQPVLISPAPYPEVSGTPSPDTVAMLKEDYAGAVSELSAITQYIFQHITTKDETFANAMLQIAIVEMQHLDLLGDAITELGGNPAFDNGHYYWNASYADYSMTQADMLQANIKSESQAIADYQKHAAATNNPTVRDLLLRITEDEELHLKFFRNELARLN